MFDLCGCKIVFVVVDVVLAFRDVQHASRMITTDSNFATFSHCFALLSIGCSLRIKDPHCWFDSLTDTDKEYTLQLSQPYDRAVCIELLRTVSGNEGLTVSKYQYQGE